MVVHTARARANVATVAASQPTALRTPSPGTPGDASGIGGCPRAASGIGGCPRAASGIGGCPRAARGIGGCPPAGGGGGGFYHPGLPAVLLSGGRQTPATPFGK